MGPRMGGEFGMDRARARDRPDHAGAIGLVAVGANADPFAILEIEPVHRFEKAMDEVLAGLFLIRNDIDTGVLLSQQR